MGRSGTKWSVVPTEEGGVVVEREEMLKGKFIEKRNSQEIICFHK